MSGYPEVAEPILNSPFETPTRYWYIREGEQPQLIEGRRRPSIVFPPREQKTSWALDERLLRRSKQYPSGFELAQVNLIRERLETWQSQGYPGVTRTTLELTDNELSYGGHETLAAFCHAHQLPYKVTIDGKYEYTGEVRVWAPGMASELLQTATNDGNAVLALSELRQLEQDGKTLADAIRVLAGFDEFTVPALELVGDQDLDDTLSATSLCLIDGRS